MRSQEAFFILGIAITTSARAADFDALSEYSIGFDALSYQGKPSFNVQADTILIDGQVKTLPVNTVTYDRTATTRTRAWGDAPFGNQFGVRYSLWGNASYRKEEGELEPRKISEEQWVEAQGRLEALVVTSTKLELFLGVTYYAFPSFDRNTRTASVDTTSKFAGIGMASPHIGVVKRAGMVSGGFYYKQGIQKDRTVTKFASQDPDDLLIFKETIDEPTEIAMFLKIPIPVGFFQAEFAAIQGSESGSKTDDGDNVNEDYTRAKLSYQAHFGILGFRTTVIHRTLSYADNRGVSLDTIPMTTLHAKLLLGTPTFYGFAGLIYGYSKDGQSIPEFNATYRTNAYGASLGLSLSL